MKKLFLLRHAQALNADIHGDKARKLSPQGVEDARTLGVIMKQKALIPDLVICSPAQRTKETLEAVMQGTGTISTIYMRRIYEGGIGDILDHIQKTDNNVNTLMVVGHNPSMHELAALLASDSSPLVDRLSAYRPGTLSAFVCPNENWADIQPGENDLFELLSPSE
jgi:phosphohistidine phosphatase